MLASIRTCLPRATAVRELNISYLCCVRISQQGFFEKEIVAFQTGQSVPKQSPLKALTPFLDQTGLLRVGGRFQAYHLPYHDRYPVILPKNCWLSSLIIECVTQIESARGSCTYVLLCHEKSMDYQRTAASESVRAPVHHQHERNHQTD